MNIKLRKKFAYKSYKIDTVNSIIFYNTEYYALVFLLIHFRGPTLYKHFSTMYKKNTTHIEMPSFFDAFDTYEEPLQLFIITV
jgi:hypothetical protein